MIDRFTNINCINKILLSEGLVHGQTVCEGMMSIEREDEGEKVMYGCARMERGVC